VGGLDVECDIGDMLAMLVVTALPKTRGTSYSVVSDATEVALGIGRGACIHSYVQDIAISLGLHQHVMRVV